MESSISDLVVPDSVKGKWLPGSEILVTSHTISWDDQQIRAIVDVMDHMDGQVRIKLDSPIPRPMLSGDDNAFPVEVALLSRNIVFDTLDNNLDGGHLTVYRTPNLKQVIEGVEFRNFGQQAFSGRYVSTFHHPLETQQ